MSLSLEKLINQKVEKVFSELGLDKKFATVKISDRPDLSDFQCNGALALAKIEKKNPREIATNIASILQKDSDLAKISVDGPGFLNISLADEFIAKNMQDIANGSRVVKTWSQISYILKETLKEYNTNISLEKLIPPPIPNVLKDCLI